MERTKFMKAMKLLTESFGSNVTPERMEIYYQNLKHITDTDFARCIKNITQTEKFFPTIAVFFDLLKKNIEVPSQAQVHSVLSKWVMNMDRNIDTLGHPVYKMMAEETGLCDRFSVEQEDFDNAIKYRYNRIVEEYKSSIVSGEQLRLPVTKKSLYPYAYASEPKQIDSGFKKLSIDKKIIYKEQ